MSAAIQAGEYLKETLPKKPTVEFKDRINLVTDRDRHSQEMIHKIIKENFPGHSILAEEDLDIQGDKECLWLIDPLDGTTNYAHSLPIFCVSIAFLEQGKPNVGVVYNPMLEEMFQAARGAGAFLNNKRIKVSSEKDLDRVLLATGFPYDVKKSAPDIINHFIKFLQRAQGIRRCGSAALDLAYLAAGRFDGFWESKLHPWDTAAACLFVEEAGGQISNFSGEPFNPFMQECLASNGHIHRQLLEIIQEPLAPV